MEMPRRACKAPCGIIECCLSSPSWLSKVGIVRFLRGNRSSASGLLSPLSRPIAELCTFGDLRRAGFHAVVHVLGVTRLRAVGLNHVLQLSLGTIYFQDFSRCMSGSYRTGKLFTLVCCFSGGRNWCRYGAGEIPLLQLALLFPLPGLHQQLSSQLVHGVCWACSHCYLHHRA